MAVSPNINAKRGFQGLTYYIFISLKKYRVDFTAQKMGCAIDTLYKKIRGERDWQFEDIHKLVDATGDPLFLEYFCNPCGYTVIPQIKDKATAKMFTQMVKVMQSAINEKENEK